MSTQPNELRQKLQRVHPQDIRDVRALVRFLSWIAGRPTVATWPELVRGAWLYFRFTLLGR